MKSGKKFILLFFSAWIIFSPAKSLKAEKPGELVIEYNPPIRSSLVYPDRALVTRAKKLSFKQGKYKLIFRNASPNLQPKSLRAFSSNPDCTIQGINSYLERKTETINPNLRKLEKKIYNLQEQKDKLLFNKKKLNNSLSSLKKYRKYLSKAIAKLSVYRTGGNATPSNWKTASQFIISRWLQTKSSLQKTEEELIRIREKIYILKNEKNKLFYSGRKSIRIVEITLQSASSADALISFSYIIFNASWSVSYGMYLQKDRRILVEYYGNIRQQTGENWDNITLKLSTATPSHGAKRPSIHPLVIYAKKSLTPPGYAQYDKKLAEDAIAEKDKSGLAVGTTPGKKAKFTTLEDSGSSLVFKIKLPAKIPSKNEIHRVTIDRFFSEKADLGYRIVPSKRKIAHLRATFVHNQPFPLLKGPVDIYRFSGFMGRSAIEYTPPGSELTVGFGAERSIKLKRTVLHYKETKGIISKTRLFQTDIETLIENHSLSTKKISIYERVPVSQVEEIKISILAATSKGYIVKPKDSGILRWDLIIPAKGKKKIRLKYQATAPYEFPGVILGR